MFDRALEILEVRHYSEDPQHMDILARFQGVEHIICMGYDLNHENHAINRLKKWVREGNNFYLHNLGITNVSDVVDARPATQVDVPGLTPPPPSLPVYILKLVINDVIVYTVWGANPIALLREARRLMNEHSLRALPWVVYAVIEDQQGNIVTLSSAGEVLL